jgi:MFS family permease
VVSSLGAPLVPTLSRAYGVSLSTGEWILTITLLTGALATPVMGRLADGPLQRRVILVALASVVVGCVLSALSNGFTLLIVGRALQGVGLGLLPVAMAIARRHLSPEKARRTIATLSVTTAIGAGLGYPVTGLIAQVLNFRAAYWFGAITVAGALVVAAVVLPPPSGGASRRFDFVGAGLLSLVVIGVSVVLSEGGEWGWASNRTIGIVAASMVLLAFWIPFELRFSHPLVDLRQVRNRSVLTADASGFLISIALYLLLPIIVVFVQIPTSTGFGFGSSLVVSGLVLVPLSAASFVASRFLVAYERHFGSRTMIPLGSVVFAAGAAFFAFEHSALWQAFVAVAICGFGVGFTSGAMPGFIVRAVAQSETGSAMGFYQVVRYAGFSLGSAIAASILGGHQSRLTGQPTSSGYVTIFWVATVICLAAGALVWVLAGREGSEPAAGGLSDEELRLLEQTEGEDLAVDAHEN